MRAIEQYCASHGIRRLVLQSTPASSDFYASLDFHPDPMVPSLMKWQYQASHRVPGWQRTIQAQRKSIQRLLLTSPSLKPTLQDDDWLDEIWAHAVAQACNETRLDCFPERCPWQVGEEVLSDSWLP